MQNNTDSADLAAVYAAASEASSSRKARRRRNKRFNAVLYCISASLILLGIFIILRSETTLFTCNSAEVPSATYPPTDSIVINVPTTPQATALPQGSEDPAAQTPDYPPPTDEPLPPDAIAPVSVYFNDHNVSCSVQPVGVAENGTMETVPSHNIAGWYKYGAAPNQSGNCIIAGHNRYAGQLGSFSLLHNGLKVGDRVTLQLEDGSSRFYRVTSIDTFRYDEVPEWVMQPGGDTRLTLITCLGDFDYDMQMSVSRVVAVCEPVG